MKHLLFAAAFCLLFASFAFAQTDEINIVPKPRTMSYGTGSFSLRKDTKIVADGSIEAAKVLNDWLFRAYGFRLRIVKNSEKRNTIHFLPVAIDRSGGDVNEIKREKYSLNIQTDKVYIGGTYAGQFYAIQSLIQIFPKELIKEAKLPVLNIVDSPRFPYRGMHLDVSRHFFPVEFVKKYIDLMAQYKFNTFHWHLTDDQGWRIEIKKYPRLTEIGSKRSESLIGRFSTEFKGDGVPVEGFYTQEQIRDVVAYAKARFITVIPEIELPGHSSAALAAYPEFGCKQGYDYQVKKTWGIFKEVYCPTEKTFSFLEDVLAETIALFPDSPYIHIGGDEVLKDMWKESPEVKELMARENLRDEHEVQSYFIRRMEKFINSKGKKIIGWDEILEGGLAPNATVMSWRGIKGGIEAAKAKHDVIMTPTDFAYLDYGQGDPATEPLNIGGYLPLEKVYSFDPVPKELSADEAKYILGGQGNIWTEYLPTPASVEYMAFPRMLAMAEAVWSTPENKNYDDFLRRLPSQLASLDKQNVNYRIPEPLGLQNMVLSAGEAVSIEVKPPLPNAKVLGTVDGSDPDGNSSPFPARFVANPTGNLPLTVKTIVVLPNGRKSSVYAAVFLRRPWLGPQPDIKEKRQGATYGFAAPAGSGSSVPTILSGETRSTSVQQFAKAADLKQPFGMAFDGYINVAADAIYEFQVESPWGASILIDDQTVLDDAGTSAKALRSAVVPLRAGLHRINLRYDHHGGEPFYRVRWGIKGQGLRSLSGGDLVH